MEKLVFLLFAYPREIEDLNGLAVTRARAVNLVHATANPSSDCATTQNFIVIDLEIKKRAVLNTIV